MTPQTFDFFARFLKERSGLALKKEKQYLLENRLTTVMLAHKIENFNLLADKVRLDPGGVVAGAVVESMTVTETSFFRDRHPFDLFVNRMLPEILESRTRSGPLKIWSAAASSGQEAYTLAMLCKENAGMLAGQKVEITATDISNTVLEKARAGIYSQFEVQRGMPVKLLLRYFDQTGEVWKLKPEIRSMVEFQPFNLMSSFAGLPQFDIIFCRNVLIYFDVPTKKAVLERMQSVLAPKGFMLLGGAETTIGISGGFTADPVNRALFRLRSDKEITKSRLAS